MLSNSWIYIMMKRVLLFPIFFAAFTANAQVKPINATIDAGKIGAPISKYVYGQFLEHIAGTINTGIWAEMVEDRKFYYGERGDVHHVSRCGGPQLEASSY